MASLLKSTSVFLLSSKTTIALDFYKNITHSINPMKNTNHYGLLANGKLINLGVGADTSEVANLLADNAESVASVNGNPIDIVHMLNINDLYTLAAAIPDLLNNLDNEALSGATVDFGIAE